MCAQGPSSTWRGVPLTELYGASSPWGAPEFPLVVPAYNHAVLYHIPSSGEFPGDRPPKAQIGHDKWDQDHVRMPCSSHSLYPVENANGETRLKKRWELIEHALWRPLRNSKELADAIVSYNTKFKNVWKFKALHKLFNEYLEEEESQYFFDVTLPEIAKLALSLPKLIQAPIPLLKQNHNNSITLSQQQISCLLANAFFCTFPRRNSTKRTSEYVSYPFINFNRLYESSGSDHILEKLKCICHYFRRVCTKAAAGVVTFSRRSVGARRQPCWLRDCTVVSRLPLHVDAAGTIEDAHGLIQVDFANKYLGGGVLNYGCVQEEIRFIICPELMVSMLFTEVLRFNEALMIIGSERYSSYTGYGSTFQWSGDYIDTTPYDSSHRRRTAVLAIDATPYSVPKKQYNKQALIRELNKAWIGFSFYTDDQPSLQYPGIATGNWGCGAFGGSHHLKSILQMMASVCAKRPMAYYTFGDRNIRDDVIGLYNTLSRHNVTVGQLFQYLVRFSETDARCSQLHQFIQQAILDDNNRKNNVGPSVEAMSVDNSETAELPLSVQNEFQNDFLGSPDLFSQDDTDESLIEIKVDDTQTKVDNNPTKVDNNPTKADNNPTKLDNNPTKVDNNQPTPRKSTLVEEMQKLDEQSGRLNLSVSKPSVFNCTSSVSTTDTNTAMDTSDTHSDATTEMKKRVSKKITDYFSKKSI